MSLEVLISERLKEAMKAKDTVSLETLRAIKAALILLKTEAKDVVISTEDELKLIQKLIKQRKDSLQIFQTQGRKDLADAEASQIAVLEQFLPQQLSEAALEAHLKALIAAQGATSIKDMGKVMGIASKELVGKVESSQIASALKKLLS